MLSECACPLQVSKTVVQDDFEAGQVLLSASVSAESRAAGALVPVRDRASTNASLVQQRGMSVSIAVVPGQATMVNTVGE